jgi:hypothetical protein
MAPDAAEQGEHFFLTPTLVLEALGIKKWGDSGNEEDRTGSVVGRKKV